MGISVHWFLPTSGDGRNVVPGAGGHGRAASIEYLSQIARAADDLGFDAVLTGVLRRRLECRRRCSARNVDVYLLWGEPPAMAEERIKRVQEKAAAQGRSVRFGMRLHVITRDTEREAWAEADRLLDTLDPALIDAAQQLLNKSESVGQQRMLSLHGGTREDLEVSPNLWAGIGLVRPGAGTALVGSHEQVAQRILDYHDLGLDEFILSGHPHLEEAYAVGEGLLPLVTETDGTRLGAAWPPGGPHEPRRSSEPATSR